MLKWLTRNSGDSRMTSLLSPPTLEYSDGPPNSRLIVSRDGDAWVFVDPPRKFWHSIRELFAYYLIYWLIGLGIMWGMVSWLAPFFSFPTFLRMMLGGFGDRAFVFEMLVVVTLTVVAIYAGTKQALTITLSRESVTFTSTSLSFLMKRFSNSLVVPRDELKSVSVARLSPHLVVCRRDKNRKLHYLIHSGRADAQWLAKRIAGELLGDAETTRAM